MRLTVLSILLVLFIFDLNAQDIAAPVVAGPEFKAEIDAMVQTPKIRSSFDIIEAMEPQSRADLVELTEIPAPPFKEVKRADRFKEMLEEAGADKVYIDEVGNVVAIRKGVKGERTVVLDAHLDTVFPEGTDVTVRYSGDTMKAPGIGDDTRGLVVALATLRALNRAQISTNDDVWIVGSVGEEGLGDLRGVKHLFREGAPSIDSWISIDGGGLGRLATKALGSKRYKVVFSGPGGHSWGAFGLANPHHALSQAVAIFVSKANEFTREGERTSYNVGKIGGGVSVNTIPYESWMEVDMRSVSPERLDSLVGIFKASMQAGLDQQNSMRRYGEELTMELVEIGDRPSGDTPNNEPLVQRAIAATNYFGVNPTLGRSSTNANIPISLKVPAVTIGRGGEGGNGHALNEWWLNRNGSQAIKLALLLTVCEAGMAEK